MEQFMKKCLALTGAALFALLPLSACKDESGLKTIKINEVTHSVFYRSEERRVGKECL